ncbi:tRNA 2-selenouridine(34) synthase MnmH [Paenibacillus sp. GCM10027626]|uniref:tRNA 2-selenouridine(34) synthase MnmH n=1 Tax=Paenibacillus sp. GCM10027626 TaxID=3273411 RepID=UPI003628A287
MFQAISIEQWRTFQESGRLTTVDVRSPSEFKLATIPGSINIPLFDDAERAEVGTIYKQVSIAAAKERGLEIVSAKLPAFIKTFTQLPGKKTVFCWRGGMRSKTTATLLSLMSIQVNQLSGGYRAYRQHVVEQLAAMSYTPRALLLQGHTGSGKTVILRRLGQAGHAVLDLEEMAGHRGSIFGEIGMEAHNQKMFDGLLLEQLLATKQQLVITMEAESRRIGKIVLPDIIMRKKESGMPIIIELPLGERVQQILQDYKPWEHPAACSDAFQRIKSRIHTPVAHEIQACLNAENYEAAVELLLHYYYDPRYSYSISQHEQQAYHVKADNVDEAYRQVEEILLQERSKRPN